MEVCWSDSKQILENDTKLALEKKQPKTHSSEGLLWGVGGTDDPGLGGE